MRDPASPASLERRIVVTAPPALADLTATGDPRVLEGLVELLGDAGPRLGGAGGAWPR